VRVKWLRAALANLNPEAEYIAGENPAAAAKVVAAIHQAVENLRRYPAMGRPGRVAGTRELIIAGTPYIVPYRVRDETVEVLRVFHGARR
jgi:toxin ParE1/3/4